MGLMKSPLGMCLLGCLFLAPLAATPSAQEPVDGARVLAAQDLPASAPPETEAGGVELLQHLFQLGAVHEGMGRHVGDVARPVATGVEVQLYATPAGKERLTDHDAGGIIPGGPPTKNAARPAGEWNHMHVLCENGTILVTLNGELVHTMSLDHARIADRPRTGRIGFQDHSLPLALRRWRVRRL